MSVLIKGMKMPKDCPFCPMAHFNKLDALTGCDAVPGKRYVRNDEAEYWLSDKRPDWCPLVEVPTPHGPLIDADKLLKKGINLSWSVQKWVSEVDIGLMRTIIEAEEGEEA